MTANGLSKLVGARVDQHPQLGAVGDLLHLVGQAAVAGDPFLDRLRVVPHQLGGSRVAGDLHAGGPALVEIGLVEPEARARRHAHLAGRQDAEQQGAGGIADAVDDDPLALVAQARVLRFVLLDLAAVVAGDAVVGPSLTGKDRRTGAAGEQREPPPPPPCRYYAQSVPSRPRHPASPRDSGARVPQRAEKMGGLW